MSNTTECMISKEEENIHLDPSKSPFPKGRSYRQHKCHNITYVGARPHGWSTCIGKELQEKKSCVIYGFGIGAYLEWDIEMSHLLPNCNIYSFDPTPTALQHLYGGSGETMKHLTDNHFYVPLGLAHFDGILNLFTPKVGDQFTREHREARNGRENTTVSIPVQTLHSIMNGLGHSYIDILKIDIEGGEFEIFEQMHQLGTLNMVGQLMFEAHFFPVFLRNHSQVSPWLEKLHNSLSFHGLKLFHQSKIRFYLNSSLAERSYLY